jgi:hypothetical protein
MRDLRLHRRTLMPWPSKCRTLMRPLLVTRHTLPESGFFRFFPPCEPSAASRRCGVLTCFPYTGANHMRRPHTRLAVPSPLAWRLPRPVGVILCARAIMWCPPPVLRKTPAARVGRASACPARGRGSTRTPWARQRCTGRSQSGCPINRPGSGIRVLGTPGRSKTQPSRRCSVLDAGAARAGPGRPQAPPLCAFRPGSSSPYRTPLCA